MKIYILLIFLALIFLFWPVIKKWTFQFLAGRAEDFMRRQMGLPSRKEEKRSRKKSVREESSDKSYFRQSRRQQRHPSPHIPFPKEQAVDVEFTEYREFSQTIITGSVNKKNKSHTSSHVVEQQIEDVEFTEIVK